MKKDNIHEMRENIIELIKDDKVKEAHRIFKEYIELLIFALLKKEPFYANVIIQLNRKYDLRLPAAAGVSMNRTYFDLWLNMPMFIVHSTEVGMDILKHECLHILNLHLMREKMFISKYDRTLVNIGMDAAINQFLPELSKDDRFVTMNYLRRDFFVEPEEKKETEYYIELIAKACHNNPKAQENLDKLRGQNKPQNGQGMSGESDESGEAVEGQMSDSADGKGTNNHDVWKESDKAGSVADMKDMVKDIANEAATKSRGKVPGHIESLIKRLNERPVISWQKELRLLVGSIKIPFRKTIQRRDRRQPHRYDIRGRISDRTVKIVIVIDTSGSVDKVQLQWIFREIFGIIKNIKFELHIIECDTRVTRVYKAKTDKDIKLEVTGRGGTSFSPAIEYINENLRGIDLALYFTDGYGEYELNPKPKNYKMLWVLTGGKEELSIQEPFGKVKELNYNKKR